MRINKIPVNIYNQILKVLMLAHQLSHPYLIISNILFPVELAVQARGRGHGERWPRPLEPAELIFHLVSAPLQQRRPHVGLQVWFLTFIFKFAVLF